MRYPTPSLPTTQTKPFPTGTGDVETRAVSVRLRSSRLVAVDRRARRRPDPRRARRRHLVHGEVAAAVGAGTDHIPLKVAAVAEQPPVRDEDLIACERERAALLLDP